MTVSATFNDRYIVVNSTQIARFSFKTFTTDRSFKKMVVARDRKHHADVKCEKHRFPRTLPMIFDRLSRHLGFSNLARLISRVSNLGLLYLWSQHTCLEVKFGFKKDCKKTKLSLTPALFPLSQSRGKCPGIFSKSKIGVRKPISQ